MIRIRKGRSRRPYYLNIYQVFDSEGLWFTFFGGTTTEAIESARVGLEGRNGCVTLNGNDLACFSVTPNGYEVEIIGDATALDYLASQGTGRIERQSMLVARSALQTD